MLYMYLLLFRGAIEWWVLIYIRECYKNEEKWNLKLSPSSNSAFDLKNDRKSYVYAGSTSLRYALSLWCWAKGFHKQRSTRTALIIRINLESIIEVIVGRNKVAEIFMDLSKAFI